MSPQASKAGANATWNVLQIPRGVWALGFVSLLMDISSEMIHALLPVYLVTVLGASMLAVGVIEGVAEATAMIVRIFSGTLSDWLGRRKLLAVIGYGLGALAKPIFPLAPDLGWIVSARFIDRVGKGIRGAPRDALIADLTPAHLRGASYGLRQALDTIGAFFGPLLAIGLMVFAAASITTVFWIAVIPAFASLALIAWAVKEPTRPVRAGKASSRLQLSDLKRLPSAFWIVVAVAFVLTLARFSEAFLVLRAQNVGLSIAFIPAVMVVMNIAYALAAYPAGAVSDSLGRRGVLIVGTALLIVADLILAVGGGIAVVFVGVVFWGLHMALTQGLLAAFVADTAPARLRGTAFGILYFTGGRAMLIASVLAGALWDAIGPAATFLAGAGFTVFALAGIAVSSRQLVDRRTVAREWNPYFALGSRLDEWTEDKDKSAMGRCLAAAFSGICRARRRRSVQRLPRGL
jgi:MFS family permease